MKRRLLSLLLAMCLLAGLFTATTLAASESDLTFTLNSDGESYSVTDCDESAIGELTIPTTYNGKPVTSIGNGAFFNCDSLTSITIPDGVTSIGNDAFGWSNGLTSVTIPSSVTNIGDTAFAGCTGLTDVYYNGTQEQWNQITIGSNNDPLQNATIHFAEPEDPALDYLTFTLNEDGKSYSVTDCDESFSGELVIPATYNGLPVVSIGGEAFYECTSLISVTIPDSVTSIGAYAFDGCANLASVTIPSSITSIGDYAFGERDNALTQVHITDIAAWCKISFDSLSANPLHFAGNLYLNGQLVTKLEIPDSITSIGTGAFYNCTSLTSVIIPDSVTSIGDCAFWSCTSLTSVTIPDSVTSIGFAAFHYCTSLTSVTIPDSVTSIGEGAFRGCSSLTSITIPDSVTSINSWTFAECYNLASIAIPDVVTSIGRMAFTYCTSLTNITIPDSVTDIGVGAFRDCSSMTTIIVPDSVTSIDRGAFDRCTSLNDVYFGGTQEQWEQIAINSDNDPLLNATIHFTEPEIPEEPEAPAILSGDVNGDGVINLKDVALLQRFVAGWPGIALDEYAADVNRDGTINMKDAATLSRYVAGWPGIELK